MCSPNLAAIRKDGASTLAERIFGRKQQVFHAISSNVIRIVSRVLSWVIFLYRIASYSASRGCGVCASCTSITLQTCLELFLAAISPQFAILQNLMPMALHSMNCTRCILHEFASTCVRGTSPRNDESWLVCSRMRESERFRFQETISHCAILNVLSFEAHPCKPRR